MKRLSLLIIVISSLSLLSCRVKEQCEINHTGTIAVINRLGRSVELRVDNEKIGDIESGKVRTMIRTIGSYDINVISYPDVWDTTVTVVECDTAEYILQ